MSSNSKPAQVSRNSRCLTANRLSEKRPRLEAHDERVSWFTTAKSGLDNQRFGSGRSIPGTQGEADALRPVRGRLGNGRLLSTARRNRDQSQGRNPLRLDSKRKGRAGRLDEQGSADRKSDPIRDDYPIL